MARKSVANEAKSTRTLTESDLKRLPWRSIGPATMGGRISDMAFFPGNSKAFVVGYASGGLWVTKNHGTTFEQLFKTEETSSIGAVAVCDLPASKGKGKSDGKGKIIWVGTGEGNGRNSSSWGNGMYRSTDGGESWDHLGLEETHDIPRIAVPADNPDVCFVAALGHLWGHNKERGVYRTTDGGKTWKLVLSIDDETGACDVMLHPKDPSIVYAAMYSRLRTGWSFRSGGAKGGIYRSVDGGETWKQLKKGLPTTTGRIGMDIYAADPKKLIAVVESTEEGANSIRDDRMRGGGVFRSDDGGDSWTKVSVRSPRAFYFSKVKFDPQNDDRVYMLGWTTEVSDDGGKTFRGGWADLLHADHHAILVDPTDSDHIIVATDGGASQTFDGGKSWDFLNTIPVGQFYNISLDNSDPYRIIGGLQDNGTWVGPSATGKLQKANEAYRVPATGITNADWQVVFWGDGFHGEFHPTDPDIIFAEWQGGNIGRVNMKTGEMRYLAPAAREGQPRHRFNWNSPFLISAHDADTIYHAGNFVFKMTKRGESWQKISPDLTTKNADRFETVGSNAETYCTVVSLAESRLQSGLLWTGSDDGLIHITKDDGASWQNVTPAEVNGRYISRIEASPHDSGTAFASIDGHRGDDMSPCILMTEDFGKSWRSITGNLPGRRSVMVVRQDIENPNLLYCGTENAVYLSLNRGGDWVKCHGNALPTVPVYDIKQHARERDIVLGTHGLSIWILDGAAWLAELTPEVMAKPLHIFQLRDARPQWYLDYSGLWTHKVFRANNPPAGLRIDYWISEYTGDDLSVTIEDSAGALMKKLSGSNAPGYNRITWDLVPETWRQCADQGEDTLFQPFQCRPGEYKVKMKMGKLKAEGTFNVIDRRR